MHFIPPFEFIAFSIAEVGPQLLPSNFPLTEYLALMDVVTSATIIQTMYLLNFPSNEEELCKLNCCICCPCCMAVLVQDSHTEANV